MQKQTGLTNAAKSRASAAASTDNIIIAPESCGATPIKVNNVVATVNLNAKLDLKKIALRLRNAEYNPKRFSAVIIRIRKPDRGWKATALVFASGKMVVTGAKSTTHAKAAATSFKDLIKKKLGYKDVSMQAFRIQNVVGTCDCKFPIRLEGLAVNHRSYSTYEPELFPGLIYRMGNPKVVLLVFVSGKVVITGAKSKEELSKAFENIYPVLDGFRKQTQAARKGPT